MIDFNINVQPPMEILLDMQLTATSATMAPIQQQQAQMGMGGVLNEQNNDNSWSGTNE